MVIARLTEVRLLRFKSFRGATVPLGGLTILTGRNSSGKSNVLDAIGVLSRISGGEPLGDALDGGRREGGPVRGGSRGCAPYGETSFKIGCRIEIGGDGTVLDYDVEVVSVLEGEYWGEGEDTAGTERTESPDGSTGRNMSNPDVCTALHRC